MQVGIIGAGAPSMAGLLASMALSAQSTNCRGFRFVYKNEQDGEHISRVFEEDTLTTRASFLRLLRQEEFNYDEKCALSFSAFKDTEQIYKEFI